LKTSKRYLRNLRKKKGGYQEDIFKKGGKNPKRGHTQADDKTNRSHQQA
jgi:hypothetical protein